MSAPGITYSGVLARKHANASPNANKNVSSDDGVFKGLKFWISARVPPRKTCVDIIQENGGTVVPIEGNADMLICDPAKEPVPNSYSYRLIADAARQGSLDGKEDYLCDLPANRPKSSRPLPATKLTRNKFTKEDDQLLIRFVTEQERLGEHAGGNKIYKTFAEEHPNHTWQSWRDRWAKKLSNAPRPPISNKQQSPRQNDIPATSHQEAPNNKSPVTRKRARFTVEEDDILLVTIHRAIKDHEPWNGYQPYKQLASELPQRTFTSWRDRALNHVAKQYKDQIAQWELETGFDDDVNAPPVGKPEDQQSRVAEDEAPANSSLPGCDDINGSDATHRSRDSDENKKKHQHPVSSPISTTNSAQQPGSTEPSADGNASAHLLSSPVLSMTQLPEDGAPITTKEQFYRDYNTFIESAGIATRQAPSIAGEPIALWDLWKSVRSKKMEVSTLDWQQVAEDLGFDRVSTISVPGDIQQCYEEYLAPFADAIMSFDDRSDDDLTEDNADNADTETEEPLPSSPPLFRSLKRPLSGIETLYQHSSPQSSPKRRRINHNHEVPSTPQRGNKTSYLPPLDDPDKTPTVSRPINYRDINSISRTEAQPSPVNIGDDEIKDEVASLPFPPQGRKRQPEPEIQGSNFDPDMQANDHGGSDNESQTPSQQLLLESDAASPGIRNAISVSATPRQKTVRATPTPRHKTRVPLEPNESYNNDVPQRGKGVKGTKIAQPKPRVLPSSWISATPTGADATGQHSGQSASATISENESRRRPTPPRETPDDIVDHFVSLGYTRDMVLRSLKATSWIIGNAGQVMEMLKQGEPLPPRTTGVWTQRDDDALALAFSDEPPVDAKAEKKRAKEMKRLQAKHGTEQITLRKRYLLDEAPE
ncbi:putative transcription factor [Rosellinia necatrix]|uniref:DNA-binding protein RAP1 n=1 Tax=Rosellinia necatrix TaxID=77044 RepID=A0A1W2TW64_ROSNE|nr:putative transcription factor [Rosellinia necatrix]